MPDGVQWKINGLRELDQRLRSLPENLQKKALRNAVGAGGRVIRDDARSRVHSKSGDLVSGIRVTTRVDLGMGQAIAKVFVSQKKAWYGRLVEYGTLPHLIRARNAAYKNAQIRRGVFGSNKKVENRFKFRTDESRSKALSIFGRFFLEVEHPGSRPRPFMHEAVDASMGKAITAITEKLKEAIDKFSK